MDSDQERLAAAVRRLDALSNWETRPRVRMRPSLDPIHDLLERLENPQRGPRVVHVAGSKGKGSVAALVSAGLRGAGLCVGTYASPHVERMNERVALDGTPVGDGAFAAALERALDVRAEATQQGSAGREATWFDTVTAAGLLVFRDGDVDWIVAECGLGGRLDSTNVLQGVVCVITGIELEHTNVLGDTRAAIAAEKAGILKPGSVLVSGVPGADEAGRVIDSRAAELGLRVVHAIQDEDASIETRNLDLAGRALDELGRLGHAGTAGAPIAADLLDEEAILRARLPGRLERRVVSGVPVVLDGAHTPGSLDRVLRDLEAAPDLPGKPLLVLGLAREKDLAGILKTAIGRVDRVLCTSVGSPLHLSPDEIESYAGVVGLVAEKATTPRVALNRALELATKGGGWILVTGSLYLAGEVRPLL